MKSRVLTAIILFPPVIYLIGWSPLWIFVAAIITTVTLGLQEYVVICRQSGIRTLAPLVYAGGWGVCLAQVLALRSVANPAALFLALFIPVMMSLAMLWVEDLKQYLGAVATTILGILYIGVPMSFLIVLRSSDPVNGRDLLLFLFLVIWAGDICAYLVGRPLGRHFLFPRLSPRKTFEGALGGLGGSLLAAWAYTHWVWKSVDLRAAIIMAGLIAIAGQVGDFVESALKRGAGVKDSGTILPGHGGMLDRIDALLFGAATLWLARTLHLF